MEDTGVEPVPGDFGLSDKAGRAKTDTGTAKTPSLWDCRPILFSAVPVAVNEKVGTHSNLIVPHRFGASIASEGTSDTIAVALLLQ